jgi:hypothetical protein
MKTNQTRSSGLRAAGSVGTVLPGLLALTKRKEQ